MLTELNLDFAKICVIETDLAEVIINNEIELTLVMVNQLHKTLCDNLTAPFSLLINKTNNYSYDFEAMLELGTIKEIKAIAILCYTEQSKINSEFTIKLGRKKSWNANIFDARNAALDWIAQQR